MKKTIKNVLIILKKIKFIKYFWIFGIFLFMLINFSSISFLTNSSLSTENNVSNEIKDLFKKNVGKKELIYKFLDEFKKEKEIEVLTSGEVGHGSSIQSLGENKYLVGTNNKGFWFLKFNDNGLVVQSNKIQDKDGVNVSDLTTDEDVGILSSIQSLGENKYLVGTNNKGFWFLKFNDNGLVVQANKIKGVQGVEVEILTDGDVGYDSSIQELGSNKYLVGTGTEGFWFLKFDDNGLVVQANKLQDENGVDVSILTADGIVGSGSSIQSLKNNKYLIGTQNKGFWLLEFDNNGLVVQVNKIQDKDGADVPVLTTFDIIGFGSSIKSLGNNKYLIGTFNKGFWLLEFDNDSNKFSTAKKIEGAKGVNVLDLTSGFVGWGSSIQKLGENKYLVGTNHKGFWFLKFNNSTNKFNIVNKIQDKDGNLVSDLTSGEVGRFSSIQKLGDTNKYLVGTFNKGFWLLEFDNNGLVVQANKIKKLEKVTNNEFDGFYNEKIEKFKNEYKKLQTFSNFESNDKIFWKEFVMEMFDIDEENKKAKIDDDYSFSNKEIWTEKKLKKFKEWLVEEKDNSWKRWLWFLIIIPIILIVIYLLILFIKKNRKRIINNNKNNKKK